MFPSKRKLVQSLFLLSNRYNFTSSSIIYQTQIQYQHLNPSKPLINHPIKPPENETQTLVSVKNPKFETDVALITEIIKPPDGNYNTVINNLNKSGVLVSPELVSEVLSRVWNDWKPAITFFNWAGKQPNYVHSYRQYNCIIAILGKMRRFDDAWMLIDEMKKGGKNGGESMVTTQTLLIMIRRYSAVHDVSKAIKTFYAYKRFGFAVGVNEFHDVLSALCRYKNVKEAEVLMKCNEDVYPLTTKSYNIILNGWCNVICSPREGKRIWWEMCNRGIARDVVSYSTVISCYSKCNETREVVKIFNELKASCVIPDLKVYNSVIYSFCKAGLEMEARELLKSMDEKGISPNVVTYNSIIMPLCKKGRKSDALKVFDEMLQRGLKPSVLTYHAFFRACGSSKEAFSMLQKMNEMGCCANHDTYTMLIRKFCRWDEFENVWKVWNEMVSKGVNPDRSAYVALVNGLFLNGKLEEAYNYHVEMKSKGLLPEAEMEETLQAWMDSKQTTERSKIDSKTPV